MKHIKKMVLTHKFITGVIVIIVLFSGYKTYIAFTSREGEIRYITTTATKNTIIVSVMGSGQVSVSNQVDIKSKASGELVYISVKNGQEVRQGALIAQVDTRDAEKAVSDAQIKLDQEKLILEKLKGITTPDGTIRSGYEKASDDLKKSYEDGFNTVANAFLELPTVMAGLKDILQGSSFNSASVWNMDYYLNAIQSALGKFSWDTEKFRDNADLTYQTARKTYDNNFLDYKAASRFSGNTTIEALLDETYTTSQLVAEAIKNANNLIQFYKDTLTTTNIKPSGVADVHLSQLTAYTSKTNGYISSLLSTRTTIQNNKEAIVNVRFDVADQEIKVKQAERTLVDAKQKLSDCYIYAPFSGVIAKVDPQKGDSVSSASVIATLITKQRIAKITLNEIDVAKVTLSQKATLTFDAIPDLTIAGQVSDIDTLGTVSQGVVSYTVEIIFDTQDSRVKPGMSASASIVTDIKQNVIAVPSSALKTRGETHYVELFDYPLSPSVVGNQGGLSATPPHEQTVGLGISNDTKTEITFGLKEGDIVVVRTINPVTQTAQTSAPSLFGGGNNRGTSGARIPGR